MGKPFYITTAIDYVNGEPHLGHAYEKILTDAIARGQRSLGADVFFLTGLDEHGQKVQQTADANDKEPQKYCDELAEIWRAFAAQLQISNDDFVRTTELRHTRFVQAALSKLFNSGLLYKAPYRGCYSLKEETFLTDRDRQPDGSFSANWGKVVELTEDNYYLKIKDEQQWLIDYIESHPNFVAPSVRQNEVLGFLRNNTLEDLCISRPASRLNWGVSLPFDPEYVTYVWFDALLNYVSLPAALGDPLVHEAFKGFLPQPQTAGQSLWPAAIQVVGKDIIKFHAVYWPILLKLLDLPLPKQILVHGFWQKDHQKISKTLGNTIDLPAILNHRGIDALRYHVLRELPIGADGNWTEASFEARYNAELADALGNLVHRSLSMLNRYRAGLVPAVSTQLATEAAEAQNHVRTAITQHDSQNALIAIWALITQANQYIERTAPFRLAKDPTQSQALDAVLYTLIETTRVIAVLLHPFLPKTADAIYSQLALGQTPAQLNAADWGVIPPGHRVSSPTPLFPKTK